MKKDYAIKFQGVSKIYKLKSKDKKNKNSKSFYALKDISFEIPKGEVVGILGTNGSGKSTLSMILSGISSANEGVVDINGEQALIAINTGLNKHLTGYENIVHKSALLGLSKSKIKELTDGVVEFAELGDFLYQPVKKYSSGMKARLGFAINMCLDPEIIIVDEALSVGDKGFANKCINKMLELKEQGKTIVFISHSLPQVKSFCDTGMWIEGGELREYGDIGTVSDHYSKFIDEYNKKSSNDKKKMTEERFNKRIIKSEVKENKVLNRLRELFRR